jgi:hypothetical protein
MVTSERPVGGVALRVPVVTLGTHPALASGTRP